MKLYVRLTDTSRLSGPIQDVTGASGARYRFVWSEERNTHLLEGKDLSADEFNRLVPDLIARACLGRRCIPFVVAESEPALERTPPQTETAIASPEKLSVDDAYRFVLKNVRVGHVAKLARRLLSFSTKKKPSGPPRP